ncbi:unnamed protein product [Chrysoparadoxa australica]
MAIIKVLQDSGMSLGNQKIIYIAPLKALCQQRIEEWRRKFAGFNLRMAEVTGDVVFGSGMREIAAAQVIFTTPEKWDSLTRHLKNHCYLIGMVRLLLVDEIHTMNDPGRGATLEMIIARMKALKRLPQVMERDLPAAHLRCIALSATLPNVEDIAGNECLDYFGEEFRPIPLTTHVLGYHGGKNAFLFDRSLNNQVGKVVEKYDGLVSCLVATTTLALGVNLPARLVVVKNTSTYRGAGQGYQRMACSTILQMLGRAGRLGLDTEGVGVIMTSEAEKKAMTDLIKGKESVESQLPQRFLEALNSEVAQGNVIRDVSEAIFWLKSTFCYIRMRKSPSTYSLPAGARPEEVQALLKTKTLEALKQLSDSNIINMDEDGFSVSGTPAGMLFSKYMVSFPTMETMMKLPADATTQMLLGLLSSSSELAVSLRRSEKKTLNELNAMVRYPPPTKKFRVSSPAHKALTLLQAALGRLPLDDWSLKSEQNEMVSNGARLLTAASELMLEQGQPLGGITAHILLRSLRLRIWENARQGLLQQLGTVGEVLSQKFAERGLLTIMDLCTASAPLLDNMANRKAPFGRNLVATAKDIMSQALTVQVQRPDPAELTLKFHMKQRYQIEKPKHSTDAPELQYILIAYSVGEEDNNDEIRMLLNRKVSVSGPAASHTIELKSSATYRDPEIHIYLLCKNLVGVDLKDRSFRLSDCPYKGDCFEPMQASHTEEAAAGSQAQAKAQDKVKPASSKPLQVSHKAGTNNSSSSSSSSSRQVEAGANKKKKGTTSTQLDVETAFKRSPPQDVEGPSSVPNIPKKLKLTTDHASRGDAPVTQHHYQPVPRYPVAKNAIAAATASSRGGPSRLEMAAMGVSAAEPGTATATATATATQAGASQANQFTDQFTTGASYTNYSMADDTSIRGRMAAEPSYGSVAENIPHHSRQRGEETQLGKRVMLDRLPRSQFNSTEGKAMALPPRDLQPSYTQGVGQLGDAYRSGAGSSGKVPYVMPHGIPQNDITPPPTKRRNASTDFVSLRYKPRQVKHQPLQPPAPKRVHTNVAHGYAPEQLQLQAGGRSVAASPLHRHTVQHQGVEQARCHLMEPPPGTSRSPSGYGVKVVRGSGENLIPQALMFDHYGARSFQQEYTKQRA